MLTFPYLDEPLTGPAPPSLPASAVVRWRPLVPVSILGPSGIVRDFGRAVLDPAADDTVFPLDTAVRLGAQLVPDTGHRIRWRGQMHPLRFGNVELLLTETGPYGAGRLWWGSPRLPFAIPFWDRPAVCNSWRHASSARTFGSSWKPTAHIPARRHDACARRYARCQDAIHWPFGTR